MLAPRSYGPNFGSIASTPRGRPTEGRFRRFDVDDAEHGEIVKLVSLALVRENGETKRAALLQAILDKADGLEGRQPEIAQEDISAARDRASYGLLPWMAVLIMIGLGAGLLLGSWIAGLSAISGRGPC